MPLSKEKNRERMRELRRLKVSGIMRPADVRAMRKAGLNPEDVGSEEGKVSSGEFYSLMRDRDAIKAHLSWHHESVTNPDVGTLVERQQALISQLQARVTMLEANFTLHEAQQSYEVRGTYADRENDLNAII